MFLQEKNRFDAPNDYSFGGLFGVPLDRLDPYLIWIDQNKGRRIGLIRSADPHRDLYVQVVVEIWPDGADAQYVAARTHAFSSLVGACNASVRRVYDLTSDRFVTMIVPQAGIHVFLTGIGACCERYESSHPVEVDAAAADQDQAMASKLASAPKSVRLASTKAVRKLRKQDEGDTRLSGDVIAVIDYGCPFAHSSFRSDMNSRVRYVWFQDAFTLGSRMSDLPFVWDLGPPTPGSPLPKKLFPYGRELRPNKIDELLTTHLPTPAGEAGCYEEIGYDLMRAESSHGGHILDIAAGWPNPLKPDVTTRDKAGDAKIIFVQFPRAAVGDSSGAAMSVYLLDALRYIDSRVTADAKVSINLSYGTHAGPHDGSSMLERSVDDFLATRADRFKLVLPAGNSFLSDCHAQGIVSKDNNLVLDWEVMADDPTDTFLEIWHAKDCPIKVSITPPGQLGSLAPVAVGQAVSWAQTAHPNPPVLTMVNCASSTPGAAMTLCVVAPTRNKEGVSEGEAPYGIWKVLIETDCEKEVAIDAWIERDDPIFDVGYGSRQSRFVVADQGYDFDPDDEYSNGNVRKQKTFNSYASAQWIQTVGGAIGPISPGGPLHLSAYSSAGPSRAGPINQPKFIAVADETETLAGVNAGGNRDRATVRRNGTSVAAPQLTRAFVNGGGRILLPGGAGPVALQPSLAGAYGRGLTLNGQALQYERAGLCIPV